MPKLSPLQWIILILFQAFYGFAVLALTRDYYQRHPPGSAPVAAVQQAEPEAAPIDTAPAPLSERLDSASAIPETVVQKDPRLLSQLADQRFARQQYREAAQLYRRVLELTPDAPGIFNDLGLALYYSGDTAQALHVLKQGVAKAPSLQRIHLSLGFVQMHSGERAQAAQTLREAFRLGPDTPEGTEAQRFLAALEKPQPQAAPAAIGSAAAQGTIDRP
jgi:tetratricopeptide (TPR) repeat protein